MSKAKVLFICVHNSARSQMAEAMLRKLAGDRFEVESAGFEPGPINPLVIEVMREEGVDLSQKTAQSVFSLVKTGKFFGYVITVCNRSLEEECPIFPGIPRQIHWDDLEDPADYTGTHEEKLARVRDLKGRIKLRVEAFIREFAPVSPSQD